MKTAVSIPTPLFEAAERQARPRGITRSRLYAEALQQLLAGTEQDDITARLNAVYATEDSSLDPFMKEAQRRALAEPW